MAATKAGPSLLTPSPLAPNQRMLTAPSNRRTQAPDAPLASDEAGI
jgi:hypothetical protein